MAQAAAQIEAKRGTLISVRIVVVAWLLTAVFYFYQYSLRSAPAAMMPQLSEAFGVSAVAVASIVGLFYCAYSPFSLVAGAAMDRIGPRRPLPVAAVNFLNFTFSALLGLVFGRILLRVSRGAECLDLHHYPVTFAPLLIGVGIAIVLAFLLKETGPATRRPPPGRFNDETSNSHRDRKVRTTAGTLS